MRNICLTLGIVGATAFGAFAQNNMSTTYCAHSDLNASRFEPSELNLGEKKFQIGFNYYLWAGNSSVTYQDFQNLFTDQATGYIDFDAMVSKFEKRNVFGVGQDIQLFGLAYQINKNEKKLDLSLTVVDRFATTFDFSDVTLKLIAKGNKQFAGQTVNIGDFTMNANYMREFAAGFAAQLVGTNDGNDGGLGVRIGGRLKYLQGVGAVRTMKSNAFMTTDSLGRSISIDYDYELATAGMNKNDFSFFNSNGMGVAVDLGAAIHLGNNLEINASLLDLGYIKYNSNTKAYAKQGSFTYDGAVFSQFFGDINLQDSVNYLFKPEETTGAAFGMPLGGRFLLQAEIKTPQIGNKDREYVSNALFVTYVQGFINAPGATTRPYMSIAYNHDFHKVFDLGLMASYGGFNKLGVGAFGSVNILNTLKLGFGSDNILALFRPDLGTGIDASFNLSFSL